MDLLDLQLDLDVEGSSTPKPITRRSQASRTAKTTTPASTSKTPRHATPKPPVIVKDETLKSSEGSSTVSQKPKTPAPKPSTSSVTKAATTKSATKLIASTASSSSQSATSSLSETPKAVTIAGKAVSVTQKAKTATPKTSVVAPKVTQLREATSESPSISRGSSADRTSRSTSTDKRSRNKAKKRFSPSPVASSSSKKRKSAVSVAPKSAVQLTDDDFAKNLVILREYLKKQGPVDFELPAAWNVESSDEKETDQDSNIVVSDNISKAESSAQKAEPSTLPVKKPRNVSIPRKSASVAIERTTVGSATSTPKEKMPGVKKATEQVTRASGGSDGERVLKKNARCRTYSKELGVDDSVACPEVPSTSGESSTSKPRSLSVSTQKKTAQQTESKAVRSLSVIPPKAGRRSQRRSTAVAEDVEMSEGAESSQKSQGNVEEAVADPNEESSKSQKRVSKRKSNLAVPQLGTEEVVLRKAVGRKSIPKEKVNVSEGGSQEEPSSSTASDAAEESPKPNPNSALAIRQKLLKTQSLDSNKSAQRARKSMLSAAKKTAIITPKEVKKDTKHEEAVDVPGTSEVATKRADVVLDLEPTTTPSKTVPSTSAPETPAAADSPAQTTLKTPPSTVRSTRTSGRVSKPNRLYVDQDYNTNILGRNRITEQNLVIEAQASEVAPVMPESSVPSTSTQTPRPVSQPKKKPAPKEVIPKPIPVVNGVLRGYIPSVKEPLADLEVDGVVEKLNEIVTSVLDVILFKVCGDGVEVHENIDPKVVRAKAKAKADTTKRARVEAKKLDIQMSMKMPSTSDELGKRKRHAPKADDYYWTPPVHKSKLRDAKEDRDSTPPEEEPEDERQQKARESISHLFDAEMDATMREAKKFSVSFEKYIKPKISAAQKKSGIKLMSRKRNSMVSDDFYYHELLVDQPSPTTSNIENEDVDVDRIDEPEEPISEEGVISIRTDALDIAEQIAVLIARPTQMDGSPITAEDLYTKVIEQTESRQKMFRSALHVVLEQLAHESAPAPRDFEEQGCNWHSVTSANAQLLKNVYTLSSTDREDVITWTHQFMVSNLPVHILASYLSLLRYARRLNPTRFGFIISSTDQEDGEWAQATNILKSFVYRRATEPGTEVLNNTIPYDRMTDTVFLLVSPTMTFGATNNQSRPRLHGRLFRWLQSIGHIDSEMIGFNEDHEQSCSVAEYLSDVIVETICDKVRQKAKERPHCRIVLVGYGATTYLVHRAVNLVEGVSGIISIGFPVMTKFGRRGTADDEILLTYCPTLFIVGAEGQRFNNKAMTEMRSSMVSPTGLVVVGHANDSLLVPTSCLLRLGVSQTVVFRIILEKILDFLNLEAIRRQDPADLVPIELNNVYELDSALLKSEKSLSGLAFATSSTPAASPVGSSGRRATVAGGEEMPKKKRLEQSGSHQQQQGYHHHGAPPTPSPRAEVDFLAFQNLMVSTVATVDDMPRRASMGSSPRVVERGDFRDRSAALKSAASAPSSRPVPPPVPRGPIDPASISLN